MCEKPETPKCGEWGDDDLPARDWLMIWVMWLVVIVFIVSQVRGGS